MNTMKQMATDSPREIDVSDEEHVTAKRLKENLSEYVGRVQHGGAFFVVTKNGKPAAALVPIEALLALHRLEDAHDAKAIDEDRAADAASGEPDVSLAALKEELGL